MTWHEFFDIVLRWIHLIAGIMWIGNSLLFNWLDRNLERTASMPSTVHGKIWLLHSGAFYEVEKKLLEPNQMPKTLHWFKWQNFSTWISGMGLLVVVYYMQSRTLLVDPNVSRIHPHAATALSIGFLILSWPIYDFLWKGLGKRAPLVASVLSIALLFGAAYGLTHVLSGRAAYIHIGAMMGTLATGNVWMVIVPSQRALVRATIEGKPQDIALSLKAKERSIHNNYMTFPILFIMISNHFASTYGNKLNWVVLMILMVGGALVRHIMNIRFTFRRWVIALVATMVGSSALLLSITWPKKRAQASTGQVSFAKARAIIYQRCLRCHSEYSTDPVFLTAPNGVKFDTPEEIQRYAVKMKERVTGNKTMPLGNVTEMTEEERTILAEWVTQGASVK